MDLAADAIEIAAASRHHPIEMEELAKRFLPDRRSASKVHRFKLDFSLRAGAMIRAGVQPDLLEDAAWWRADDLWVWALEALHVYVEVAAERTGVTPAEICASWRRDPRLRSTRPAPSSVLEDRCGGRTATVLASIPLLSSCATPLACPSDTSTVRSSAFPRHPPRAAREPPTMRNTVATERGPTDSGARLG